MESGTLLSHVDTDLVTREQLALVETPDATRSFKPVPHIELIDTLEHVLKLNRITIRKEQFALRRDGSTLFGVLAARVPGHAGRHGGARAAHVEQSHDVYPAVRGTVGASSATTWSSAGI